MIGMALVEIRRPKDAVGALRKALDSVVFEVIQEVHYDAQSNAPVDSSKLRNNLQWSLNGIKYGGYNTFPTTAPESPWGRKPGAFPVGAPAEMEDPSNLLRFPSNTDPHKSVGYVSSNVKDADGTAYNMIQEEYGYVDREGNLRVQPFFRPAIYEFGESDVVTPKMIAALRNVSFGPLTKREVIGND